MMQTVPNSGLLGNDRLDEQRTSAIRALAARDMKLPEELVYYLRAIEDAFMDEREQLRKQLRIDLWGAWMDRGGKS